MQQRYSRPTCSIRADARVAQVIHVPAPTCRMRTEALGGSPARHLIRHVWQRVLVDLISMQPASDADRGVLDHDLADLMDRRPVCEVGYVSADFLGMRPERRLVSVDRVTQ